MSLTADRAATALVRALARRADHPFPRTQARILHYLVERGYVGRRGMPRTELRLIALRFGRSESLVVHAIGALVATGAVLRWYDEWGTAHYAYDSAWDGASRSEEVEEPAP